MTRVSVNSSTITKQQVHYILSSLNLQLGMCQGGQGPYNNLCNTEQHMRKRVFMFRVLC